MDRMDKLTPEGIKKQAKDTLWHIDWGDGDTSFVIAPDKKTAIERMPDGNDMVNTIVKLDGLYQMIFKAGAEAQLAKALKPTDEELRKAVAEGMPKVLFHKVIHEPQKDIVASIKACGLIPQVASEYKDLVPEEVRFRPVIWLASRLHSYTDAPVFLVQADKLKIGKLHHVVADDLDWWVYEDAIPADQTLSLFPELKVLSALEALSSEFESDEVFGFSVR